MKIPPLVAFFLTPLAALSAQTYQVTTWDGKPAYTIKSQPSVETRAEQQARSLRELFTALDSVVDNAQAQFDVEKAAGEARRARALALLEYLTQHPEAIPTPTPTPPDPVDQFLKDLGGISPEALDALSQARALARKYPSVKEADVLSRKEYRTWVERRLLSESARYRAGRQ
jgi:hypothetical protein